MHVHRGQTAHGVPVVVDPLGDGALFQDHVELSGHSPGRRGAGLADQVLLEGAEGAEVRVRIDHAGEHVLPSGVDHLGRARVGQLTARHEGHPAVLDADGDAFHRLPRRDQSGVPHDGVHGSPFRRLACAAAITHSDVAGRETTETPHATIRLPHRPAGSHRSGLWSDDLTTTSAGVTLSAWYQGAGQPLDPSAEQEDLLHDD